MHFSHSALYAKQNTISLDIYDLFESINHEKALYRSVRNSGKCSGGTILSLILCESKILDQKSSTIL